MRHAPTLTHDRTIDDDISDALYSVFGTDGIDPNWPIVSAAERRALRRALADRCVDPARVLVPRLPPRFVPAVNRFELDDAADLHEQEVA